MRTGVTVAGFPLVLMALICGCGGGGGSTTVTPPQTQVAAPAVTTKAAQNGAVIVSLATSTSGATIHYTVDGTAPSAASPIYQAPFLVASNVTVKSYATVSGD